MQIKYLHVREEAQTVIETILMYIKETFLIAILKN